MHILCNENGLKPVLAQIPAMLGQGSGRMKTIEGVFGEWECAFPVGVYTLPSGCLG